MVQTTGCRKEEHKPREGRRTSRDSIPSPRRGLPHFPCKTGGWHHRLISVMPPASGTTRPIPVFQRYHMSFLAFFFIVVSLLSFVAAQLILKRAMQATKSTGFRNAQFVSKVTGGVILMTFSFFLTLGLLQRFDLSYLYPFQGLSVIFITLMAAVMLKEKLNLRLTIGALLISAGIVLVSLS